MNLIPNNSVPRIDNNNNDLVSLVLIAMLKCAH